MIIIIEEMSMHMTMLNEINYERNARKINNLRKNLGRVSKDVNINTSESKECDLTNNEYLPGGTLTSTLGKLSSHVVESTKRLDKLGEWNAI